MKNKIKIAVFALLFYANTGYSQNTLFIPDTVSGPMVTLQIQNGQTTFFPGFTTQTMGFNGNILGPTILLRRNRPVDLRVLNTLSDTTTVHWHGLHVAPQHDGGPHTYILPGAL